MIFIEPPHLGRSSGQPHKLSGSWPPSPWKGILLSLGMGGEWATGVAQVAEKWPADKRGKAMGIVQSSWAIGYALAAVITALVLPRFGWRAVFFVGVLPAF